MKFKIVADSAANRYDLSDIPFTYAPLKIIADKEYVDDEYLDVYQMAQNIKNYNGKSTTSCPNSAEWEAAFGDAEYVFGVAITSQLSGSYNSGILAANEYMEKNPERKVYIIDSLSTGPEMKMIVDKLRELILEGLSFEEIKERITEYMTHTYLLFCLESVANLAKNGRVNPAIALAVNALGIRIIGDAEGGKLNQRNKVRGEKKGLQTLYNNMKEKGFKGGKVYIGHNFNETGANRLKELILADYPECIIDMQTNHALNCFYAELGGILVGFEDY